MWPEANRLDFVLQKLVDLKKTRNAAMRSENSTVSYNKVFEGRDPDKESNRMSVLGNPSLSDVRVMMIGVRNNASTARDGIVWVNELKVTDFDESGGWAAKANVNLGVSDIATFNFGTHYETSGFGAVDQPPQFAAHGRLPPIQFCRSGRCGALPSRKDEATRPVFYSVMNEKSTPQI